MLRNYLKGVAGDQINTILAGTGFNLKKMLNRIKAQIIFDLFRFFYTLKQILFKNLQLKYYRLFQV